MTPILPKKLAYMLKLADKRPPLLRLRDRAILLLAWSCSLRRSDLVALDREDLLPSEEAKGSLVTWIRESPNDARGTGKKKLILASATHDTCPVRALAEWLRGAGIRSGPVFRLLAADKNSVREARITDARVFEIIQMYAGKAGLDVDELDQRSLSSESTGAVTPSEGTSVVLARGEVVTDTPANSAPRPQPVTKLVVRTAADLAQGSVEWLKLPPFVAKVFGRFPVGSPWSMALWGPPGSMKSTSAVILADALCDAIGPVAYISLEEGHGQTISERLRRLEVRRTDLFVVACPPDLDQIIEAARECKAKVVMIDSLGYLAVEAGDLTKLSDAGFSYVTILHATKGGQARGKLSIIHHVDVVVGLEGGGFKVSKNRFQPAEEGTLPWRDGWPKKTAAPPTTPPVAPEGEAKDESKNGSDGKSEVVAKDETKAAEPEKKPEAATVAAKATMPRRPWDQPVT
jgi:hypothetical protein